MIVEIWTHVTASDRVAFFHKLKQGFTWKIVLKIMGQLQNSDYLGNQKLSSVYNAVDFIFSSSFKFTEKLAESREFPYTISSPHPEFLF